MSTPILEIDVDFRLQDDVDGLEKKVQRRLGGRVRDFRLRVHSEGLILQGSAATYHAKQLAQHAIMEATQVPILANEIEVCSLDSLQPKLSWA